MSLKVENNSRNNSDFKVEGDMGDLQIIEESSESDEEEKKMYKQTQRSVSVSNLPNNLIQTSSTPVINSVAVTNSENVQFGNNTYFNGAVTIKQIIQSTGAGIDNASYVKSDNENMRKQNIHYIPNEDKSVPKSRIKTWHKLSLVALGVGLIASICAIVFLTSQKDEQDIIPLHKDSNDSSNPDADDDLLIAPDHLRIVSRTDWLAQPVDEDIKKLILPVPWVIVTHTATASCFSQSSCVLNVRLMQTFHIESRGWSDISYNFLVGGDGSAYCGRGWYHEGAHTKGYNHYSISIAFIGTFNTESPTVHQVEACRKLIRLGVAKGIIAKDYKLLAHRQLMSTLSPGDTVYNIIKTWPHFFNSSQSISTIIPNY